MYGQLLIVKVCKLHIHTLENYQQIQGFPMHMQLCVHSQTIIMYHVHIYA